MRTKKISAAGFIFYAIALSMLILTGHVGIATAGLQELEDGELAGICGQDGITLAVKNVQIFQFIDAFTYCCPENAFGTCQGLISLQNIKLHSRTGGPAWFNYDFGTARTTNGVIFIDVGDCEVEAWEFGTVAQIKKVMTRQVVPYWDQEVGYYIDSIYFGDPNDGGVKDLGWADLGCFDLRSYQYYTAPHGDGVDFEYDFEMHIDTLTYGYQTAATGCKTLEFNDIHIGSSFDYGLFGDDPTNPSTWKTDIGEFKIGDMFGDAANGIYSNPATIDAVDRIQSDTGIIKHAAVWLNLPLQGSVRFEQAEFGGVDFGPGAIDGIHSHRMMIELVP
jgi:hypothetical protein